MQKMTPLDRFLSMLFDQYRTEFRPRFASRFNTWLGTWLLGSPADKGLDAVMPELQGNYYNIIVDRRPPRTPEGIEQWDEGSRFVMPVRFQDERFAGKGMWLLLLPLTFALCLGAGMINVAKEKVEDVRCQGLRDDIEARRVQVDDALMQRAQNCGAAFARIDARKQKEKQQ